MGCHFLPQGIFLTQGLNFGLLHCRQILCHLSHQGGPQSTNIWWGSQNTQWGKVVSSIKFWDTGETHAEQTKLDACAVLSRVWLFATLWTVAHQALPSMGILQARILQWIAMPYSKPSSQPRDRTPALQKILYLLSHQGSPRILKWITYLFSKGTFWPRNQTGVSCIAGGFFSWTSRESQIGCLPNAIHKT